MKAGESSPPFSFAQGRQRTQSSQRKCVTQEGGASPPYIIVLLRLLLVSAWLRLAAVSVGIYVGGHWSEGAGRTGCRELGWLVLRRAYVAVDQVLFDAVYHDLHRLRFVLDVDPDRLVEIHP